MNIINYWQKISKRLIINTALSHLLLGVIAAGFGLYQENALPAQSSTSQVGIIAITLIVQDHQTPITTKSQTLALSQKPQCYRSITSLNYRDVSPNPIIRLSPNNGIRAGPNTTA
ncbi:hypothetical protein [Gilliamella apicola]|uniref:hypothetical protein n=1 Tax=Gilliamella apicola TaxID=1196095 RepID=UPI00080E881A|nr:hypothetical protein [Gilliamella apicola]OCG09444.1 hypothetical protein A9G14_13120 [Gilliamella apicola]ORF46784.1 hypothetical protein B5800_00940 [Gilliamella apicola]ORF49091.1 hypothetical protein B5799_06110 [Gilliamella apicola]ORF50773.1 hypothetical protein B5803_08895 [Gilliamella apicola]ORF54304.1 hypothetical protein B5798_06740 [Gilliamella apicola]